jgi:hypothetical protein
MNWQEGFGSVLSGGSSGVRDFGSVLSGGAPQGFGSVMGGAGSDLSVGSGSGVRRSFGSLTSPVGLVQSDTSPQNDR